MRKVIAAVLNDLLRASLVIAIAFSHIAVANQETVRIAQIALLKSVIINQELISEYSMPTDTTPPGNIVIVGGGSAGWMTASLLLNSLGEIGSKITLIESSRISAIGVGEGTTPLFKRFLDHMNISEEEFMSSCKATYKLGINFPGWTNSEEFNTYFHPFAAPGYSQYEQQFSSNCNLRRKGETADTNPGDFFFNAEMAEQRKAPVGPPPCDSSKMDYAYHFDTMLLADFLKKRCLEQGRNISLEQAGCCVQRLLRMAVVRRDLDTA
jgi:glycine/D-amino acid oxidase-like deaminating enzyme